jgi:hypothetical protein
MVTTATRHHGDHGCHNHGGSVKPPRTSHGAAEDYRVTRQQDFAHGDYFGGMQELADAKSAHG